MFSGFGVESNASKSTKNKIDLSSIFGSGFTSSGAEDVEGVMSSLMGIGKSLMPEMESVANELKDVIDTPEVQETFASVKENMQGVLKEITPERKGQKIMMPPPPGLGAQSQLNNTSQGTGSVPRGGARGGGVNIKEYHKHITTLITAYT